MQATATARWILAVFCLCAASTLFAQEEEERGERGVIVTPDSSATAEPQTGAAPEISVDRSLPPLDEWLPEIGSAEPARILIREVVLEGDTVLPREDVDAMLAGYAGRRATMDELQELRYRLSEMYVRLGYVSSGVTLPDQRVDDGIVRLIAVEGSIDRITITGNRTLDRGYVEKRLRRGVTVPVRTNDLQRALRILQADPRIQRINARLLPGAAAGESTLDVRIEESVVYWVTTAFDNWRSPAVDENRLSLSAGNINFTGHGDVLAIDFRATDGLDDFDVSYDVPLTAANLRAAAYYGSTDSIVVERPFNLIDIQSDSRTVGAALSRPFRRDSGSVLTATLGLEKREADNWLLGEPFSFTPGEQDGHSEVSVAYLTADWLWPAGNRVTGLMLSVRHGVGLFDPTINASGPDSDFSSLRAQFQHVRVLDWRDSKFVIRSSAQLAATSLLALEKFSVGGHTTVRGYRENQLVRDNGLALSIELQVPLFVDEEGHMTRDLLVAPFIDYGVAWDRGSGSPTTQRTSLRSIGVGFHWRPTPNWVFRADYGYAIDDVVTPTDALQDQGLQFRVEYRMTPRGGR